MKTPHRVSEGTKDSGQAVQNILPDQLCPNTPLCQRWSADDGGTYCRLCWRDYTHPKPLRIVEGRA